ncbi:MAG TPA: metallophosphoesterase family protein [Gaiellaceae bacterium]|nr:metallophosphoesterase family protein [Gaiellaceae bacterium]
MRVAVVSDIHGNLHALEAVLADIVREEADEVWCLGDVVGYGPHPNECCALAREHAVFSLCGNHDLAVVGGLDLTDFSGDAAVAARWTRDVLAPEHADWLRSLAASGTRSGIEAYHGSPRDPVWDYVLSDAIALESLALTTAPLVLVGHSHVALGVWLDGDHLDGGQADASTEIEWSVRRSLLNPGSVGQPRDADPRAAWLALDLEAEAATFRRTEYDVAAAQRDSRAAGLPEILAARLAHGM